MYKAEALRDRNSLLSVELPIADLLLIYFVLVDCDGK
jgi:hypothetical protein